MSEAIQDRSLGFLAGGGDVGARIRTHDWSATPLGPVEAWPQSLRTAISIMLNSKFPTYLGWGPDLISFYNDAYRPFLGTKPDALGRPFREVWSEAWATVGPIAGRALAGEASYHENLPLMLERKGFPEETWWTFSYSPIRKETGGVGGVLCTVHETTNQVLTEGRLRFLLDFGDRLRSLGDPRAVMLAAAEAVGRHLGVARAGYGEIDEAQEVVSVAQDWTDGTVPSLAGEARILDAFGPAMIDELRAGRTLVVGDCLTDPRSAGDECAATWASIRCRSLIVVPLIKDRRFRAILYAHEPKPSLWTEASVKLLEDVAERTWAAVEGARAEQTLRELNETLEQRVATAIAERKLWADIFETTDAFVAAVGLDYRFLVMNKAYAGEFERIYGLRPHIGDNILDLLAHLPNEQAVARAAWGRAMAGEEFILVEEFGDPARARACYEVRFNHFRDREGRVAGVYQYLVDVTERQRSQARLAAAEEQLRQTQKMEAVGQLTGGVAHDFNNLLQAMSGCLRMIERRASSPAVQPLVEAGRQAVDRGTKLVQQLMAFARRQALRPEPVDVRDRVLGMSELLGRALRGNIEVETEFEKGLWPVLVDPTQFELAIINLAVNARDAMPDGGRLRIEAHNVPAAGDAGDGVRVSVSDTGMGMAPSVQARAFEPFFTTKGVGEGSGLGLAQVYGFARQSGGTVEIDSAPGRGTTITLLLPRTREIVASVPAAQPGAGVVTVGARVLLVEDDPVVASTMAAALEDAGYEVARVPTADDAVPLLTSGARIDVLFSDVVMPGRRSGVDLAHEARRLRPSLPVVLTTGYSEDVARVTGVRVLAKPYRVSELIEALETAIGEKTTRTG